MNRKLQFRWGRCGTAPGQGDGVGASGFSLLEMLVVVGILALLVGLLLPAVAKTRDRADRVQCASNSRQILVAWTMYSHDFNDRLPPNVDGVLGGFTNWVAGNMAYESDAGDRQLLVDPNRSLVSPYLRQPEVFKCPGDESAYARSVSMNCRLNPIRDEVQGPPRWVAGGGARFHVFRKLADIGFSERIFVILDEDARFINDAYFAVDMSNTGDPEGVGPAKPYYMIDYPASYHSRGATVSFADGHTSIQKWSKQVSAKDASPPEYIPAPNADVAWLQEHCSY